MAVQPRHNGELEAARTAKRTAWTLIGLTAGVALLGRDRPHIAWAEMARLAPTCVIGVGVGLFVFTSLDSRMLARGLGALVLIYGLYALWLTTRPLAHWRASPRVTWAMRARLLVRCSLLRGSRAIRSSYCKPIMPPGRRPS